MNKPWLQARFGRLFLAQKYAAKTGYRIYGRWHYFSKIDIEPLYGVEWFATMKINRDDDE